MNRIGTCFSSLRIRLVLLVLLAVIPSLGVIVYTDIEQRRLAAADAKEHAMHLAQLVSRDQQGYVDGTRWNSHSCSLPKRPSWPKTARTGS